MLQHPDRFSKSQQALPPTPISKWDITCVMYSLPPFMYDVTPQVITPRGHFIYLHMHTYSFCYYTYTPTKKTSCLRCNKWVFDWTITNPVSIFSAPSLETFSYNTDTLQSPARRRRRKRGTAVLLYSKSVFPRGITFSLHRHKAPFLSSTSCKTSPRHRQTKVTAIPVFLIHQPENHDRKPTCIM